VAAAAAAAPGLIQHGSRARPEVALTFDADMTEPMLLALRDGRVSSWYDERIVAYLRATRTPATIFLTGLWAETYPRAVRSFARDPLFELENHSFDHSAWLGKCYGLPAGLTAEQKREEVVRGAEVIRGLTGRTPTYFRFPGGCESPGDLAIVRAAGESPVGWDVVSGDAFQADPRVVEQDVLGGVRNGSIVVMHLVGAPNAPATFSALREIVPALRARGFRLVTLRRLLAPP
jgi:peptidoglycan/xylan/chitin deacetylase (PgdA/CDA1 family)